MKCHFVIDGGKKFLIASVYCVYIYIPLFNSLTFIFGGWEIFIKLILLPTLCLSLYSHQFQSCNKKVKSPNNLISFVCNFSLSRIIHTMSDYRSHELMRIPVFMASKTKIRVVPNFPKPGFFLSSLPFHLLSHHVPFSFCVSVPVSI